MQVQSICQVLNWDVFFCENKTFKKDRKLRKVESNDRKDNLRRSAFEKNDLRMLQMMDDKAFFDNAVYHKGCITKYLLSKAKSESLNIASSILDHDTAFRSLISDVHEDLFVGKKAFPMSQILEIYISHLPDHLPKTYPVTKLQDKLERYYDKAIIVQPQRGQGKSNFVFSSNVSIGNVVAAAGKLKSKLKTSEIEQEVSQVSDNISDDQILHSAAKILRRDIENLTVPTDDYPTPNEASLAVSMERMPSSLTKFVLAMGQKYSVQTFDQQLYSIAKQVAWTMPESFRNNITRLGGFHTLSCFIAAIGKL
ncbi:unnamed protein product [Mytilus edulis]|uniref:Uncharacterized protein n=1 Tax=Mytilus edulis TaxID=6550 RepID=A0A8S3R539_MYTED|nr:unnamed protein product [Mytilus edulis]